MSRYSKYWTVVLNSGHEFRTRFTLLPRLHHRPAEGEEIYPMLTILYALPVCSTVILVVTDFILSKSCFCIVSGTKLLSSIFNSAFLPSFSALSIRLPGLHVRKAFSQRNILGSCFSAT